MSSLDLGWRCLALSFSFLWLKSALKIELDVSRTDLIPVVADLLRKTPNFTMKDVVFNVVTPLSKRECLCCDLSCAE